MITENVRETTMNGLLQILGISLLLSKVLVVGNPLTDYGGKLSSERMVSEVEVRETDCSEPCDTDGGRCEEGVCVCNKGRTGADCSKIDPPDFPSTSAAKLDVALSLIAAIILLCLVFCAIFPITTVRQRCAQRRRRRLEKEDSQLGTKESVEVIKNSRTVT